MAAKTIQLVKHRQPEPQKSPVCVELVKEGKTYANKITEYLKEREFTIRILREKIAKAKQILKKNNSFSDNLITAHCILCKRKLLLKIDKPICMKETIYDLLEVEA